MAGGRVDLHCIIASYTALDLASHVFSAAPRSVKYRVGGGALAMGLGIWAMHFVGMLAFSLPVPLTYDIPITLGSMVPAIGGAALLRRGSLPLAPAGRGYSPR